MPSRWKSISFTAHYTGQVWVRAGISGSEAFDTALGRLLRGASVPVFALGRRLGYPSLEELMLQRHRMIDALVEELAPAQLVELAAGLSPRATALAARRGIPCLEADLPDMVALKRELLGERRPAGHQLAALDLLASRDYAADLGTALVARAPTVVVTEGLITYFSLAQQEGIFARVAALLRHCGGGTYLAEAYHRELEAGLGVAARVVRWGVHTLSRTPEATQIPNSATGVAMLRRAGFDRVALHRPADWTARLGLPPPSVEAGLVVYAASVS
ncbi:MAG: class I SAM-dependent methyltransferase [Deltaproteobacteria bacterium]|nr:class I SAM-dependent methyltransferase [Deltaproteobacteria bacterium]